MEMNTTILLTAVLAVAAIYVTAFVAIACIGRAAFANTKSGGAKSFGRLFQRAVPFVLIALIVLASMILGMTGKLTDGIVSLFSAIAGFVLGRSGREGADEDDSKLFETKGKNSQQSQRVENGE